GTTNMMVVESIGEVLVRADESEGPEIEGEIKIVLTPDEYATSAASGKIVVLSKITQEYIPVDQKAKALILQNHPDDHAYEDLALREAEKLNIPILIRADEALRRLSDGQTVTMDPEKGTVYKKMSSSSEEDIFGISDPRG
nr:Pyruvate kinase [Chlamydiota bacterium]